MSEEYEEYPDEYLDENGNPCEAEPEQKRGELKPCPFCGGMPKVNDWTLKGITDKRCFCDNEKCPVYLSKTIAIDDWNTRPIEDALNARIAELEAEVTKCHELQDSYCDRIAQLEKEIARRDEIITRLKEDAERLAATYVVEAFPHEWVCRGGCHHWARGGEQIDHAPDCPVTLHRVLMEETRLLLGKAEVVR